MSSETALTKSRLDLQEVIKSSQDQIRESLGAIEAAAASAANSEQIQHELHNLRESLTCLWFACEEAMNQHEQLKGYGSRKSIWPPLLSGVARTSVIGL